MKTNRIFLFLSLFLLASCSKPETMVNGEMFIATKGAGSYKLGAVNVYVLAEKDVKAILNVSRSDFEQAKRDADDYAKTCSEQKGAIINGIEEDYGVSDREKCFKKSDEKESQISNFIFTSLPSKIISQRTSNADGKFTIKIQGKDPVYLAAKAQRDVGGSTEYYSWLERIQPSSSEQTVMLSNSNELNRGKLETLFAQ